ncbi:MAG: peptidylprolyl isomerase [Oscillospiraceae bacterium]|nr:peptidylprolyl isomerase [Oscillospiraceae bacterium]
MNCKFCNAEIQEDFKVCPYCGKNLTEEETPEVVEETIQEEALPVDEAVSVEIVTEAAPVEEYFPRKKVWPLVLAIVGAVAALAVLAVVLLNSMGVRLLPKPNDIHKKDVYTVSDEDAVKKKDAVVATSNGKELTNTQLQIYYRMQVMDFLNYYGDYVSYLSLDLTKPLGEQDCYYDDTMTWEQYFLNIAIETWHNYQTLASLAEANGHTMGEDWQQSLDEIPASLEAQVTEGEYDSVDAMLEDIIGPGCTLEDYMEYVETAYLGNSYYGTQYENMMPTDEDAKAYFEDRENQFSEQGITLDSGLISSVRHILISPEGGTTDEETGAVTYSEDEWAACLAKAEALVEQWQNGEASEESFIALVAGNTADEGSAATGGLYEDIYKGSGMVEPFETWAIDPERKPGDVGIVKADFDHYKGYHIMYFVSGEQHWLKTAKTSLLSERTTEMLEDAKNDWPVKVDYSKIVLVDLGLA